MTEPLLQVDGLEVAFPTGFRRPPFQALRGISLEIAPGETLGVVGESGSGKSTLGRVVLGLQRPSAGRVRFAGRDLLAMRAGERRRLAPRLQTVFQDPRSSLNPQLNVAELLAEPLRTSGMPRAHAQARIAELLDAVGLPADSGTRRPHEFSGGQRQRIAIARALATGPELIVCDEPVSALDLTTQVTVLDLLVRLQRETGVAYLFITHDLDVVRYVAHRVAVMRRGSIVEQGDARQVTRDPAEDYTRRLLLASPVIDPAEQRRRRELRAAGAA